MNYLHNIWLEEIDYLREHIPEVPNNSATLKQPSFEYELVGTTIWVFKEYTNEDVLFRLQFTNNIGYEVIAELFPKIKTKKKFPYPTYTGIFNSNIQQLPETLKAQYVNNKIPGRLIESTEDNIPNKYHRQIKSIINFYVKLFTPLK